MLALGLVLTTGLGCTKAGKFAGTWVVLGDGPQRNTGDCYDEDDPTEVASNLGTFEIFGSDDGEIVIYAANPLKGASDGNSFTAKYAWQENEPDTGAASWENEQIEATLDAGILSGSYERSYGWGDYTCGGEFDFTATRMAERDNI